MISTLGKTSRRYVTALAVALCCVTSFSNASDYPTKPVRVIVAFPAGGNADLIARVLSQGLTSAFGRNFLIDNRGGAGGIIAEEIAAKADPNGYTILQVSISHVMNPILDGKLRQLSKRRHGGTRHRSRPRTYGVLVDLYCAVDGENGANPHIGSHKRETVAGCARVAGNFGVCSRL